MKSPSNHSWLIVVQSLHQQHVAVQVEWFVGGGGVLEEGPAKIRLVSQLVEMDSNTVKIIMIIMMHDGTILSWTALWNCIQRIETS
jgi:hypothetical protein